jgi:hypothetical protein
MEEGGVGGGVTWRREGWSSLYWLWGGDVIVTDVRVLGGGGGGLEDQGIKSAL